MGCGEAGKQGRKERKCTVMPNRELGRGAEVADAGEGGEVTGHPGVVSWGTDLEGESKEGGWVGEIGEDGKVSVERMAVQRS